MAGRVKKLDGKLRKRLKQGDWAAYIDMQNLILLSLENLETYVKLAQKNSDIENRDIGNLQMFLTRFGKSSTSNLKEINENLRYNSDKILSLLTSTDENDLGLIPLLRREIKDVTELLGSNPTSAVGSEATLRSHVINFNQIKERKYQLLRSLLARTNSLGKDMVRQGTATVEEEVEAFIGLFEDFHIILVDRKTNDEALLMKLLEMFIIIEGYKDALTNEFKHEISVFQLRNGSPLSKNQIIKVVENYLHLYPHPIVDRIMEVRRIMNEHENVFIKIPDEERKNVLDLYNQFKQHLFDGTIYKDKFKEASTANNLGPLKQEFDKLIVELERRIAEKYQANGYTHEGFMDLILIDNNKGHSFWNSLFFRSGSGSGSNIDKLTVKGVYEKINSSNINDSNKESLLKICVNSIKDVYIKDDTGFSTFEKMQDNTTFIGQIGIKKLKAEFDEKVKELGQAITQYYQSYEIGDSGDDEGLRHLQFMTQKMLDGSLILVNSRGKTGKILGEHTLKGLREKVKNSNNKGEIQDAINALQIIIDSQVVSIVNLNKPRSSSGNPFGGGSGNGGSGSGSGSVKMSDADLDNYERVFIEKLKVFGRFVKFANGGALNQNNIGQRYTEVKSSADFFLNLNSNSKKRTLMFQKIVKERFSKMDVQNDQVDALFVVINAIERHVANNNTDVNLLVSNIINVFNNFKNFGVIGNLNDFINNS